jgi:hypothetical protein
MGGGIGNEVGDVQVKRKSKIQLAEYVVDNLPAEITID